MVNRKKRLIWGGVCLLLLFSVFKCQISESVWERSNAEILAKKQNYKAEISKEELDDFIRLWPQFKELGLADDLIVSYEVDRPSKFIDWKSKIWFVYHKWDADRFFYVQQRTTALLYILSVRRNAKALVTQLQNRENEASKQMLAIQEQRSRIGEEDLPELSLVAEKENVLKKLFE